MGFLTAGFSVLLACASVVLKFAGHPILSGNLGMLIVVTFLSGVQLISVGILGEYIGRIYDEVRMRPKFIIDRMIGFSSEDRVRDHPSTLAR